MTVILINKNANQKSFEGARLRVILHLFANHILVEFLVMATDVASISSFWSL